MTYTILRWSEIGGVHVEQKEFANDSECLAYLLKLGAGYTAERTENGNTTVLSYDFFSDV